MKAPPVKAAVICRAALRAGQLEIARAGNTIGWRYGRRIFAAETVKWLIDGGEAIRDGNFVRAA
jgi:hypothetical protein